MGKVDNNIVTIKKYLVCTSIEHVHDIELQYVKITGKEQGKPHHLHEGYLNCLLVKNVYVY